MSHRSGAWTGLKRASYLVALGLASASLWKPVVHTKAKGIDYLVVFDVSLSMATEDHEERGVPRSRLDVAKDAFRSVLPDLPRGSRVTLAGFAGNTVQVFLLSHPARDLDAIEAALSVLEWDNVWEVGSRIDRVLRDVVSQAHGSTVFQTVNRRAILPIPLNVYVFTDGGGEDVGHSIGADATAWYVRNARVTFLGLGQPWSSSVPEPTRAAPRDCLRDEVGQCLSSRLNERNLQALAGWLEGRYERLEEIDRLRELFLEDPLTGTETEVPRDVGGWFGLASLAFFLLALLL